MYSSFYDDTKSETLANSAACRATEREKKSELPSRRFFLSFFFILYFNRHAARGIQSCPAKLPEFILDKRRRGGKERGERRG